MSLRDNVGEILKFIESEKERIEINDTLFEIFEGDLLTYVKRALSAQLDRQPYKEAKDRIPGINILRKVVNKLSTLYIDSPMRITEEGTNQDLVDWYSRAGNLDSFMQDYNKFFNLFLNSAIEPYVEDGEPRFRIIPSNQFLVWSDDRANPTRPTVFIKFMGTKKDEEDPSKSKQIYWLYTDDEFLAIDSKGGIVFEDMQDNLQGINPIGKIPFVYINKSRHKLLPNPDTDLLSMTLLVPILLADLNFAAKYQTFSIVYGIDIDVDNLEMNPSALWNFKSDPQGQRPEVGTIKPNADINDMLASIQTQLGLWLETRDLRATTVGTLQVENAASGIALMVQNLDTTQNRKQQEVFFREAEMRMWELIISYMHPYWVSTGEIKDKRQFTTDKVMVRFKEQKPLKTEQEAITNVIMLRNEGLLTKEMAIRELYPNMTETEIERMVEKLEEEQRIVVRDEMPNEPVIEDEEQ